MVSTSRYTTPTVAVAERRFLVVTAKPVTIEMSAGFPEVKHTYIAVEADTYHGNISLDTVKTAAVIGALVAYTFGFLLGRLAKR